MLAARKVPARAEVDRGPAREPDVGRAGPPRRRQRPDGVRRRRQHPRRRHRLRPGRRRVPDAVPGADHGGHRHVLPRPVPGSEGQLQLQDGVLQHRGPGAPTADRGSTRPSRAKSCSTSRRARWAWIPSNCAARNILRGDEMPYFNPNGMPYDHVAPADTFEQAVKILDHEGFRKEQADALAAGPLHRTRLLGLHRADRRRDGPPRAPRARPSGWSRPARSTSTSTAARRGNSIETTVVQLTADALGADIDDVATIQGDTAVTPYGAGTQGSRSGPMTAGAVNEAGTILRKQIVAMAAHRLERRRSRHRAGRTRGPASATIPRRA